MAKKKVPLKVPMELWRWHGFPGHFIGAPLCLFRLCTEIGAKRRFRISTLGGMKRPDALPPGEGESPFMDIGYPPGSIYETMVFRLEEEGECECDEKCGMGDVAAWAEVYLRRYRTAGEAAKGHMEACHRFAEEACREEE